MGLIFARTNFREWAVLQFFARIYFRKSAMLRIFVNTNFHEFILTYFASTYIWESTVFSFSRISLPQTLREDLISRIWPKFAKFAKINPIRVLLYNTFFYYSHLCDILHSCFFTKIQVWMFLYLTSLMT